MEIFSLKVQKKKLFYYNFFIQINTNFTYFKLTNYANFKIRFNNFNFKLMVKIVAFKKNMPQDQ